MVDKLKISGLMSVHQGTDPEHLQSCLASIRDQSRPLDELVIVIDGPVDDKVEEMIAKHDGKHTILRSPENQGLGAALQIGLEICRHPLTARFDSDDIYPADRLKIQSDYLESHHDIHILGGQIDEFEITPGDVDQSRQVPLAVRPDFFTARRNPMNHMTAMFRTNELRRIGGYSAMRLMQDYELWLRALSNGLRIANLPDTLAQARIGGDGGLYKRRRGVENMKSELAVFRSKVKVFRFPWVPFLVLILAARLSARLLPSNALKAIYMSMLRK